MGYLGDFTTSQTIYVDLTTYDSNGSSVTLTGLAITDIEIYKDGSVTQRASDNGYVLLDTDGIDFDGTVGLHGYSVDLSDNSDVGFYANGSQYWLVVNAVTIDGQTVVISDRFTVGMYLRPTTAGRTIDVAVTGEVGLDFDNTIGTIAAAQLAADCITAAKTSADLISEIVDANWDENIVAAHGAADSAGLLVRVLGALISQRSNNPTLNALLGVADTAGEDVPGQTAFEVADEVYTGATHNITNSLAKRIRQQQETGTYGLGAIWVDSVNGVAGTTDFDNGTFIKPVDTMTDANILAASLNIDRFVVGPGSTFTFDADQTNQEFLGKNWTLALGGQNIGGTHFNGAEISGVSTGVPSFDHCHLNICTFAGGEFTDCALQGAITLSGAVAYTFISCYHNESGAPSTIDFGAGGGTEVHIHNWHGNLTILNMSAGDTLHFSSSNGHLTLDATCIGGTRNLAGTFGFTDNSSGMTDNDLGQVYDRIGAPVGADLSTDLAAVKGDTVATLLDTGTDGVVISAATADAIANALLDLANGVETGLTVRQGMRVDFAALAGILNGAETTLINMRNLADTLNRIQATVDTDGNRSAVVLDLA